MTVVILVLLLSFDGSNYAEKARPTTYYVDSRSGNDKNTGTSKIFPWKTLSRLTHTPLRPGDSVRFRRGCSFTGPLVIRNSGTAEQYIWITDYGLKTDPAPSFTNPVFSEGNYGNCIRIQGSYVVVENLYFTGTPVYQPVRYDGEGWVVWEMGAIHIERTAEHCIVRNNEIMDCVAGIRSNGEYTLIERNYIHDCNRVLKEWNWGPLGIWLGADHQEVRYNKIMNISAVDARIGWGPESYGSGADGGAIEIDDARYDKSDILIHHNYSRDCQGFLEVTWTDVRQRPSYKNFLIHHNVSDDYQQFIALWWGAGCRIENNTIIRRKVNANDWGVFNITQVNSQNLIRNNIIITEKDVVIFNLGRKGISHPANMISNNLYFAAKGNLVMGKEGPGDSARFEDPRFLNYQRGSRPEDFSITGKSPAINKGLDLGYTMDFIGIGIPQNGTPDIGAFEFQSAQANRLIRIAKNGKALISVTRSEHGSVTQTFAEKELQHYLEKITGADFHSSFGNEMHSIRLERNSGLPEESYSIFQRGDDLILAAGSDRAMLYAVYDFLKRLGCRWLAPAFSFYQGLSEYIPEKSELVYDASEDIREHPQFAYRKIDIEEGRSHNVENLKQIIEWMPKVRLNILMVPMNYQGSGRVQWDNWRDALTPELKKRGLLIEVGGHGYQNFLSAKMEQGNLFERHPEWFGKNKAGVADASQHLVFNTSNHEAVDYFTKNVLKYLKKHPEIDIFDFWPPDEARWAECPEFASMGSAINRQAALVNKINNAVRQFRPELKLEVIAYGQVLQPPDELDLDRTVLVDICPINQNFEKQIFDSSSKNNRDYANVIVKWRKMFKGDISLYSYYRKYAWRSLPVVIPHYIQKDLLWYGKVPLKGISTYAEPADWFTYELNHYALANLSWNPHLSVDAMVNEYCFIRYADASEAAKKAYQCLEEVVRNYGSIPFSTLKSKEQIMEAQTKLARMDTRLKTLLAGKLTKQVSDHLSKLLLMINYAKLDLQILQLVSENASDPEIEEQVRKMIGFLESNSNEGVFQISGTNNLTRYLRHYIDRKS